MRYYIFDVLLWIAEIAAAVFGCLVVLPLYLLSRPIKAVGRFFKSIVRRDRAEGDEL